MLDSILRIFISEEKVSVLLSHPLIEFIIAILLVMFAIAIILHMFLFITLKNIRNYLRDTNRMDIEPLKSFADQFHELQKTEPVKPETFVEEKFSGWRLYQIPVVNLIKIVQMTVSVFILVGVLGTFLGLTISLGNIDASGDQLVENVAAVLSGIDIAFYTSILGMGFSLIMTIFIKLFNTEYMLTDIMLKMESHLEGNKEGGMNRLIDVSESIHQSILDFKTTNQQSLQSIVNAFAGFQEYTTGLQKSAKDLAAFNVGLSENLTNFQELFSQMKEVTDGFAEGTTKLNDNFTSLFSYFTSVDHKNERMSKAFEQTYEKVKEVSNTQIETLQQFGHSVEELKDFMSSVLKAQEDIRYSFKQLNQESSRFVENLETHNQSFEEIFGGDLSTSLNGIMTYLKELSKKFDKLGNSVVQLPEALEMINRTQTQYKHLLQDRFEELKEFNRSFINHIKEHARETAIYENKWQDAANTYEQMALINNQMINDMNEIIVQMNRAFQQQKNELESGVTSLRSVLAKYVNILEGAFTEKLDKVIHNMQHSAEKANEKMKWEFEELVRLSESLQRENYRHIDQLLNDLKDQIQILNRQLSLIGEQTKQNRLISEFNNRTGLNHYEK